MEENKKPRFKFNLSYLAGFAALVLIVAAGLVLIGWHTHNLRLIQVDLTFVPMQYNTALCFIFCGMAILFIIYDKLYFAVISSVIPLVIGTLILIEYTFRVNLGVDTVFMQPYVMTQVIHPGRIAFTTAACFVLAGISLLLLLRKKETLAKKIFCAIGILNLIVFCAGLNSSIAHLAGVHTVYDLGFFTQMAAHSSVLFLVLAFGVFTLALYASKDTTIYLHPIIPILVLILCAMLTVGFRQVFLDNENQNIDYVIETDTAELPDEIAKQVEARFMALGRIARRWEAGGRPERGYWQKDVAAHIDGYPGYQAIEWVDPSFKVRWIEPFQGNEAVQDMDIRFEDKRRAAFEYARDSKKLAVVSGIELVRGGTGLMAGVPIFHEGKFDGFILGVFRTQDLLGDIFSKDIKSHFVIRIYDGQKIVYQNYPEAIQPISKRIVEKEISFSGIAWKMQIYPAKKLLEIIDTPIDKMVLLFGSVSALLFALVVWLLQRNKRFNLILEETVNVRTLELKEESLKLDASLKEAFKSREILISMLKDNNEIREKISQSEAMFRSIFDSAGDGILIVDPESKKFLMGNDAICQMLGYSRDEIKQIGVIDIHTKEDMPHVIRQFEKQSLSDLGSKVLSNNLRVKRKDGSVFYANVTSSVVSILGKTYLMGLFHDLTELHEVDDLRRSDKLKKDFLSNMSHELRTPLNAVIGFSEVLADQKFGALNETQKDYLNDILESGRFLLSLINDILDLSKIESGKMALELSDVSLKELLEHSLIFVKEKALKHNIELSLEIAENVGFIRADERKVRQIVFNLLSNAVKFTKDGGKAGIRARIADSEVEVTVWDTGIGIAKEDQKRLFAPFMQLETPLTKKYEGTGLGLSLSKELVEMHKGRIWVESEGKGKGSSFKFTLPIGAV